MNISISPWNLLSRIFKLLSHIWFVPFGYLIVPVRQTKHLPSPLQPKTLQDLTLNKMISPDNYLRSVVADKISAKGFALEKTGPKGIVPLYAICNSADELELEKYPLPFVVKPNHSSGQYALIKTQEDAAGVKEKAKKWLASEHNPRLEWCYRDIDRKLIVEKMIVSSKGVIANDLKVFCMFGEPVFMRSNSLVNGEVQKHYMSPEWEYMDLHQFQKHSIPAPEKPPILDRAMKMASELSQDFDLIRVDFLYCDDEIYFNELTNFTEAGSNFYHPKEFNSRMFKEFEQRKKNLIASERLRLSELAG